MHVKSAAPESEPDKNQPVVSLGELLLNVVPIPRHQDHVLRWWNSPLIASKHIGFR